MGLTHEVLNMNITSAIGAAVVGDPVKVEGHSLDIQFGCPVADLIGLEVSNDRATWHPATDADGADINGPTAAIAVDDYREVRERPRWVRLIVAADGGGARLFRALLGVHKLTG